LPITGKLPNNVILGVLNKVHILNKGPKLNKLREVLERKRRLPAKLCDPFIIMKGLRNLPIFSLTYLNFFWSNVPWPLPLKPLRMLKRCLSPIAKDHGFRRHQDASPAARFPVSL
jgi:hypothetical protein